MSTTLEIERDSSTYSLKPGPAPRQTFKASPRPRKTPAIPPDYVPNVCAGCGCGLFTPRGAEVRICTQCAAMQAEFTCHQIASQLKDLIAGRYEFASLSAEERKAKIAEFVQELSVQVVERVAPTAFERQEIEEREETEMRIASMESEWHKEQAEMPDPFEQF